MTTAKISLLLLSLTTLIAQASSSQTLPADTFYNLRGKSLKLTAKQEIQDSCPTSLTIKTATMDANGHMDSIELTTSEGSIEYTRGDKLAATFSSVTKMVSRAVIKKQSLHLETGSTNRFTGTRWNDSYKIMQDEQGILVLFTREVAAPFSKLQAQCIYR